MGNLFDFGEVIRVIPDILLYLPITLELTVISMILGLMLGLLIAIVQMKKIPILYQISVLFISVIRGTPILVQLYVVYFGIPMILNYINYYQGTSYNINGIPKILFAIIALGINDSAYNAVTIRASLESVEPGQIEAATAIGMTYPQTLFRIIIPEAIEVAVPSIGNTIIGLVKSTSLAFSCAVIEMTAQAKIAASRNFRYFEAYVALAIVYWVITIALERAFKLIQNAVAVPDVVTNIDKSSFIGIETKLETFPEAKGGLVHD